jgi:hypothetical protein
MQRRDVLQSLTTVAAATAAGLAGCNTTDGDGGGCRTPNGGLGAALPRGNGFNDPSIDSNNSATEVGGATEHVLGGYTTDDETYLFVIAEYESNAAARTAASTEDNWLSFGYNVTGYVVVDNYTYVAMGADETNVTDLMTAAGPLTADCANNEISFL